jgi:hypothetical protein
MPRVCKICLSPYGREIVSLFKQGVRHTLVYDKYAEKMGYNSGARAFEAMVGRHIRDGHNSDAILIPSPPNSAMPITKATLENFGQKMLELGVAKAENTTPDQVKFQDVISAQRLILDSQKLKLSGDMMMKIMSKLFAPPGLAPIIEEGEVVHEPVQSGRSENSPVK